MSVSKRLPTLITLGLTTATQLDLSALRVFVATDLDNAIAIARRENADCILLLADTIGHTWVAALQRIASECPTVVRILAADYAAIPNLARGNANTLAHRIIPSDASRARLTRSILKALEAPRENTAEFRISAPRADRWSETQHIARDTAHAAAHLQGAVLRAIPEHHQFTQIQIVVGTSEGRFEGLLQQIRATWGKPIKAYGERTLPLVRKHPVVRMLGRLWRTQELYVFPIDDEEQFFYLLVLPWRKEAKATLVLGTLAPTERARLFFERVHSESFSEVSRIHVPTLNAAAPDYSADYDWVLVGNYVGPDRRNKTISLIDRHLFSGRRSTVVRKLVEWEGVFIDGLTPESRQLLGAYVVLSAIDTLLTFVFVGGGVFPELNPVMRVILEHHPWGFVLIKNLISLSSFAVVSRFQLFRSGRIALWVNVLGYLALDLYWLFLLLFRTPT